MNDITILVTGVGSMVASSILKSFKLVKERNISIIGVDAKEKVSSINSLDKFYKVPFSNEPNFIESIIDICKIEKVDFLIPLVDGELELISSNKNLFKDNNVIVCLNDVDKLNIILNKGKLYTYLKAKDINMLDYKVINSAEYFEKTCLELGFPNKTICFKPCFSSGSRGFRILSNSDLERAESLIKEKPYSLYVDFNDTTKLLNKLESIPELLIMEYIHGDIFNVNVLAKEGKIIYLSIGKVLDFALGNSIATISVNDSNIYDYCKDIVREFNLYGNIGLEVKRDENNNLFLIEINPRIQGPTILATMSGINFPYYELKMYLNEELPKLESKENIEMIRYWEDTFFFDKEQI